MSTFPDKDYSNSGLKEIESAIVEQFDIVHDGRKANELHELFYSQTRQDIHEDCVAIQRGERMPLEVAQQLMEEITEV